MWRNTWSQKMLVWGCSLPIIRGWMSAWFWKRVIRNEEALDRLLTTHWMTFKQEQT